MLARSCSLLKVSLKPVVLVISINFFLFYAVYFRKILLPQEVAVIEPILRFLQLLCENHNLVLQVSDHSFYKKFRAVHQ